MQVQSAPNTAALGTSKNDEIGKTAVLRLKGLRNKRRYPYWEDWRAVGRV